MKSENTIIVTGGAGFIGSNFILDWIKLDRGRVVNLDKLTYSGNLSNLASLKDDPHHIFVHGDIGDQSLVDNLLEKYRPYAVVHFAAESHVDRSIIAPEAFVQTNVVGTYRLLESVLVHWNKLDKDKDKFKFLHVSTDEVYGSLMPDDPMFTEKKQYEPNSPYSASKAASDHFVRAYHETYGLPVLTTNCSNNYGPFQFPEKLIPLIIMNSIKWQPLPIYGDGLNVRDWLYVGDHCSAIRTVLDKGVVAETYNIGGLNEKTNIDLVKKICEVLDDVRPSNNGQYENLISFVKDRPGHDRRYAMDISKIQAELDWQPEETFATGIEKTVEWYLNNKEWMDNVTSGSYREWVDKNYVNRK